MAIVKANYIPRGTTPGKAARAARRAAAYYTYRDGPDRASRTWSTSDGRDQLTYDDVAAALQTDAATYGYTYRLVVSTKEAELAPAQYRQVLGERFARYYFIAHHNTDYPHAHVIGFRAQRVTQAELREMRGTVLSLEQARAAEQQARRQAEPGVDAASSGSGQARRARERDQDRG